MGFDDWRFKIIVWHYISFRAGTNRKNWDLTYMHTPQATKLEVKDCSYLCLQYSSEIFVCIEHVVSRYKHSHYRDCLHVNLTRTRDIWSKLWPTKPCRPPNVLNSTFPRRCTFEQSRFADQWEDSESDSQTRFHLARRGLAWKFLLILWL